MEVIYGYEDGAEVQAVGSFAEAAIEGKHRWVWLLADGSPIKRLPKAFNRELIVDDATRRTAVLVGVELENGWCQESEGLWPLGTQAPTLTLDFNSSRVLWKERGKTEVLYDEAVG